MSVLGDLTKELRDYPDTKVKLEVINFTEPGSEINVNDVCTFQIRIVNNGDLDMQNVKLHLNAKSGYTQLSVVPLGGLTNHIEINIGTILRHQSRTSGLVWMKALKKTAKTQLFEAHLGEWDAGLDSLLRIYAGHDWGADVEYVRDILAV